MDVKKSEIEKNKSEKKKEEDKEEDKEGEKMDEKETAVDTAEEVNAWVWPNAINLANIAFL